MPDFPKLVLPPHHTLVGEPHDAATYINNEQPASAPQDAEIPGYQTSDPISTAEQWHNPHYVDPDVLTPPSFSADEQELLHAFIETKVKVDRTEDWLNVERRVEEQRGYIADAESGKPKMKEPLTKRKHQDVKLTVHLVPHTHDDVGWGKTVDEYFSGAHPMLSHASVDLILTAVTRELQRDPQRRFTFVEMKFFSMWYRNQDQKTKEIVKKLIKNGQLEITQGGWSATDEACPNYEDMILNMHLGHSFLQKEFGVKPRVGWMLDAFGHSEANAAMFHDFGFEALFFARLYQPMRDEFKRLQKSTFVWEPNDKNMGGSKQILTHIFPVHYAWPEDFRYEEKYNDDAPLITYNDTSINYYNVDQKCESLLNYTQNMAGETKSKANAIIPFGDDFSFQNAFYNYRAIDAVKDYCNRVYGEQFNVEFIYSTPGMFVDALRAEDIAWPTYSGDFHNYFDKDNYNRFWSGFYSTRPNFKVQAREASGLFHAASAAVAKSVLRPGTTEQDVRDLQDALEPAEDQLAVFQHHDAITGTHAAYVGLDYLAILYKKLIPSRNAYSSAIYDRVAGELGLVFEGGASELKMCAKKQITDVAVGCKPLALEMGQGDEFYAVVHNPSASSYQDTVKIDLPTDKFTAQVYSTKHKAFIGAYAEVFEQEHFGKDGNSSNSTYGMYLNHTIDPDGILLVRLSKSPYSQLTQINDGTQASNLAIEGFSTSGAVVFRYSNPAQNLSQSFGVSLKQYKAHQRVLETLDEFFDWPDTEEWDNDHQVSEGMYTFLPEWRDPLPKSFGQLDENVSYQRGRIIEQWTVKFERMSPAGPEQGIIKVIYNKNSPELIEFDVELNQIPIADYQGKDIIVNWRLLDDFDPRGVFYTDANAAEMVKREKYYLKANMSSLNLNQKDKPNFMTISGNYYPVDSAIAMRDENKKIQVTVMNDRAQGGSADLTEHASIELMQHRRVLYEDGLGLPEGLNDYDLDGKGQQVNCTYKMHIFNYEKGESLQRATQLNQQQGLQYFFVKPQKLRAAKAAKSSKIELVGGPLTYRLFPAGAGSVVVRFDNLADWFDDAAEEARLDLSAFATALYKHVNGASPAAVAVAELDLQGVNPKSNTTPWKTVKTASHVPLATPIFIAELNSTDESGRTEDSEISIRRMGHRVFKLQYHHPKGLNPVPDSPKKALNPATIIEKIPQGQRMPISPESVVPDRASAVPPAPEPAPPARIIPANVKEIIPKIVAATPPPPIVNTPAPSAAVAPEAPAQQASNMPAAETPRSAPPAREVTEQAPAVESAPAPPVQAAPNQQPREPLAAPAPAEAPAPTQPEPTQELQPAPVSVPSPVPAAQEAPVQQAAPTPAPVQVVPAPQEATAPVVEYQPEVIPSQPIQQPVRQQEEVIPVAPAAVPYEQVMQPAPAAVTPVEQPMPEVAPAPVLPIEQTAPMPVQEPVYQPLEAQPMEVATPAPVYEPAQIYPQPMEAVAPAAEVLQTAPAPLAIDMPNQAGSYEAVVAPVEDEVQWAMAEEFKPSTIMEDAIPIEAPESEYASAVLEYPTGLDNAAPQSDRAAEYRDDVGLETPEEWQILPAEYADSQIQDAYNMQLPPVVGFEI